jgi:hypothetical protein
MISNNTLSSRHFIGKQRLFSRKKFDPRSISLDFSVSYNGIADIIFNYDKEKYTAIRISKHPNYPSMVYTSNIDGQFLAAYKIPVDFWSSDEHKKYSLELKQISDRSLILMVDGKEELEIPEKFKEGYIGLEVNEYSRLSPPLVTVMTGE